MRRGAGRIGGWAALLLATTAVAQPAPPDPIGALLEQAPPQPQDEEAAETGVTPTPAPAETAPPPEVRPYVPPPEPMSDLAYESRVRASMVSAQGFQGPLDGSWTLSAPDGELYAFQLVDRGNGVVEGAWRDLRRPGATTASGFLDAVERLGAEVTLRFDGARVASLHAGPDGRWSGELDEGGQRRTVSLARRVP